MKQEDKLFELIKVLTSSEKQWVAKCLKLFNQKNNLVLFKYLDKMVYYDKVKLREDLRKASFINYLAVQKNNLYNAILKYLRLYTEEQGSQYELWNTLLDLTFLQERGLKKHCLDIIAKAKPYAEEQQQHYQLLKLISMERDIVSSTLYDAASRDKLSTINNHYSNRLNLLQQLWEYRVWASRLSLLNRKPEDFSEEDYTILLKDIQFFIENHVVPENRIVRYYFYQLNLLFYIELEDYVNAFFFAEQQIEYLDKVNINTSGARKNKLIIFCNSVTVGFLANVDGDKMTFLFKKAHQVLVNYAATNLRNLLYNELYYNQLNHYNYNGMAKEGGALVTEIKQKEKTKEIVILHNLECAMAGHYFSVGAYEESATLNNELLRLSRKRVSNVLLLNMSILRLLICIEQEDYFSLQNLLQALKRLITSKKDLSSELTLVVYQFFKAYEVEVLGVKPNVAALCKEYHEKLSSQILLLKANVQIVNLLLWLKKNIN